MTKEEHEDKIRLLDIYKEALNHIEEALYELEELENTFIHIDISLNYDVDFTLNAARDLKESIDGAVSDLHWELKESIDIEDDEDDSNEDDDESYMEDQPKLPGMEEM